MGRADLRDREERACAVVMDGGICGDEAFASYHRGSGECDAAGAGACGRHIHIWRKAKPASMGGRVACNLRVFPDAAHGEEGRLSGGEQVDCLPYPCRHLGRRQRALRQVPDVSGLSGPAADVRS